MARLWQCGFELQDTTIEHDSFVSTFTPAIDTTLVRSGSASEKHTAGSAGTSISAQTINAAAGFYDLYSRIYINISTLPSAICTVLHVTDTSGTTGVRVRLQTDGTLELWDGTAKIGNSSPTLRNGFWHRIELHNNLVSGATNDIQTARLDGVTFASTDVGVGLNLGANVISWGIISSVTAVLNFDDIAVNDNSGSSQNSWPGSGKIIHLLPNAAGDANGFATQVGGTVGSANNYTRVNETIPDDATSYNASTTLNAEDLLACADAVIGAFRNINVVAVGCRMANLTAADATAAFKVELEKTSGGTKSQSTAIIPNATGWRVNSSSTRNYPLVLYADPDGGEWTQAKLDSMQVGYIQTVTNAQAVAISTIWASIDYEPALYGTSTSTSSTSTSSTSMSSTSSSTSSTSTSLSTSSTSLSSTSTSLSTSSTSTSTSSTSSSISSTSSSTSSTSMSSTSSSTSTSSTSSSISSTSQSSTSQSSTSSSTSISSTSSSFSSTSSSQSSTSRSTSSTSFSSTSSSSSTSSTTLPPPNIDYTYQDSLTLPTTGADPSNHNTFKQYSNEAADDGDYSIQFGSKYVVSNYQYQWTDNTATPSFTWRGRSTVDTRVSPMLFQIYNVNSAAWETLAVVNKQPADVDFEVKVSQTTNVSNYYDSLKQVTFRTYQLVA